VKRKSYEAPHYTVFSSPPPLPPALILQIFSSSPCSHTPSNLGSSLSVIK